MKKMPKQDCMSEFRELAVKAAAAGKLNPPGGKLVTAEQMELSRLRAENIRLKREHGRLG